MVEECEEARARGENRRHVQMLETTGDKKEAICEEYETDRG